MPRGPGRRRCKLGPGHVFGGSFLRVMMGWSARRMLCAAAILVIGMAGLPAVAQTQAPATSLAPAPAPVSSSAQQQLGNTAGVVREVRIEGTQRIEPETVRSYLLVQPGDPFNDERIDRS